jgi:hypothetical protein
MNFIRWRTVADRSSIHEGIGVLQGPFGTAVLTL